MSNGKKVLQIQLRYNVNESDLAEQIVLGLRDQGFDVTTLFLRGKPDEGMPVSRAQRSFYFDCSPRDLKGLRRWLVVMRLYRFCQAHGFDVVIAHRYKPISAMLWVSLFLRSSVFVGVEHGIGDYDRFSRRVEAAILMSSRWKVVGVSQAVVGYLKEKVQAFSDKNTLAINNAIDIERAMSIMLAPDDARLALDIPKERQVIGCIGRLVPVKGHATLISAFARIADAYPEVLIAIIGEGRSRAELEALVRRNGLEERVLLLGAHEDALKYVKAFDIFAMPSFSEGLPLALLEALAGARPVIGSDIPSLRPVLEKCGGGYFKAGDEIGLAQELIRMLELSENERFSLGEYGLDYLKKNHSVIEFRAKYHDLIESLIYSVSMHR